MLPQNTQNQTDITHQLANPFQLEVAKNSIQRYGYSSEESASDGRHS